jgi:transcription termination/antitermination protein NusA
MNNEFIKAVESLEKEREISKELLMEAIESALVSAYKKNYGTNQTVRVKIDHETGEFEVFMQKTVVAEAHDKNSEISLEDAREIDKNYKLDDVIEKNVTPKEFGRIAAQTAKQVVVQRIREAERTMIFDDFSSRQSELATGIIQRISNDTIFITVGKTEGILAHTEQVKGEKYSLNSRIKVYIMDVKKTTKGPQVYLSRSHPGLVKRLFELEVPEIHDGVVEIKSISREAGSRTKIAVFTNDPNVDAVGACVGSRGNRVQNIVDELFGEKIDIIKWSPDPEELIKSALSPSKVEKVILSENEKSAVVIVPDYQLSLAIGKEGQNVRLAAKLCGWKIDIKRHTQYYPDGEDEITAEVEETSKIVEETSVEAVDVIDTIEVGKDVKKSSKKPSKKAEIEEEFDEVGEIEIIDEPIEEIVIKAPKKKAKSKKTVLEVLEEYDLIDELEEQKSKKKGKSKK